MSIKSIAYTTLLSISIATPSSAKASFIDDWLSANQLCGPKFKGGSYLATIHDGRYLGKAPELWSEQDYGLIKPAFKECEKIARQRGMNLDISEDDANFGFLNEIIKKVKKAKMEAGVHADEASAAEKTDSRNAQEDLDAARKARGLAEIDKKKAEADRVNAQKQYQEATAKSQTVIATAHARRDAAFARQKAAAAEAEANAAQAEADEAERQSSLPPGSAKEAAGAGSALTVPSEAANGVGVDDTTGCEWTVNAFDMKDLPAVRAITIYIIKKMNEHEDRLKGRMIKRLSQDGFGKITALPISWCDQHRDKKLSDAIIDVYDAFDGMQKSLGVE